MKNNAIRLLPKWCIFTHSGNETGSRKTVVVVLNLFILVVVVGTDTSQKCSQHSGHKSKMSANVQLRARRVRVCTCTINSMYIHMCAFVLPNTGLTEVLKAAG
jgi:hypothetical protein